MKTPAQRIAEAWQGAGLSRTESASALAHLVGALEIRVEDGVVPAEKIAGIVERAVAYGRRNRPRSVPSVPSVVQS
jgi:hypothetical protein